MNTNSCPNLISNDFIKRLLLIILIVFFTLFFIVTLLPSIIVRVSTINQIIISSDQVNAPIAIVFGAGLRRDGSPTDVLRDRVAIAAELYSSGRVDYLLLSGDNSTENYNEPEAMQAYALSLGVPTDVIFLDYAGQRTYDTCYRAKYIFGISDAILVTQNFHLPRAIFTCNQIGINSSGMSADLRYYRAENYWRFREMFATSIALIDLWITHPLPLLGDPQSILSQGSQPGSIHATNNSEQSNTGGYFESRSSSDHRQEIH